MDPLFLYMQFCSDDLKKIESKKGIFRLRFLFYALASAHDRRWS